MKHFVIRARVEQRQPGQFKAVAWAEPVVPEPPGAHAESIESRALSNEHAMRLLVGLASTLAGAIRLRGDAVDGLEIEGDRSHGAAAGA